MTPLPRPALTFYHYCCQRQRADTDVTRIEGVLRQAALAASSSNSSSSSRKKKTSQEHGGVQGASSNSNRHAAAASSEGRMEREREREERERVMHWVVRCWRSNDMVREWGEQGVGMAGGIALVPALGEEGREGEELHEGLAGVERTRSEDGAQERHPCWNEYVVDALLNDLHAEASQPAVVLQVRPFASTLHPRTPTPTPPPPPPPPAPPPPQRCLSGMPLSLPFAECDERDARCRRCWASLQTRITHTNTYTHTHAGARARCRRFSAS